MRSHSLGIDIGGTFTDIVVYDHRDGRQYSRKVLTTHDDPARAVMEGVARILRDNEIAAEAVHRLVHATTLFTNAVIERKGAVTGLITTQGFRDSLEIARELRYELYDLNIENPAPIVPRHLREEVPERTDASGVTLQPLDRDELLRATERLVERGVTSVAIVFLHAYANPGNEIAAAQLIRDRYPRLFVTVSHEVVREIREYERASTTVINAYVKPLAHGYLEDLRRRMEEQRIPAMLLLMLSNGGLTHLAEARKNPVQMLESGPAAGALAAAHFGAQDSGGHLLAFDMGGTTAKLSLVDDGEPLVAYGFEAARQKRFMQGSGLPVRISTIELIEIGAGGGSIARVDELGLLKVGPQSAGSEPGPACYGLGGTEATVTDADLVLGYLNPDYFAGGTMRVHADRAHAAIEKIARRLQLPIEKLAWGIHDVVNENMASAARVHIAERGRDPKSYAILCTGGAGPVHVFYVAKKIGVKSILCPPSAGVASALGLLVAPASVDRVATLGMRLDRGDWERLESAFRALEDEAKSVIAEADFPIEQATVQRFADGRFVGQGHDLVVPLPAGPYDTDEPDRTRAALQGAFEQASREKFSRTPPDVPVEFINIRVSVRVRVPGTDIAHGSTQAAGGSARKGWRNAYFPELGGYSKTAVYERLALRPGDRFEGPAVIEDEGSTLVVGPDAIASVTPSQNILVTF
ncbi:MAG TPA: hydantoinase/oxoprolinase family protein, partial [Casimicrobiaceae bacterium]|nr:hydantoinase/oxoprolinase family protein [Casimicrobiaceae bacterium]